MCIRDVSSLCLREDDDGEHTCEICVLTQTYDALYP
jgi:hypothetical protein